MFKKRTAFIVGAGASKEVGLPVGIELAERISTMLSVQRSDEFATVYRDKELLHQLQRADRADAGEYSKAFKLISKGVRLSNSIDDFLDIHRQNKQVNRAGKAAIVKAILEAERASRIHVDGTNIYNTLEMSSAENSWLIKFARMLGRNVPLEQIDSLFENISFIVFNYDRCIEHFLYHAVQQLYAVPAERASKIMKRLNIIHPYGDVGDLKVQGERGGVEFGGDSHDPSADNIVQLSERIRTYTEVREDEPKENIDIALQDAENWIFIGFGYHEQNLKLLQPGSGHSRKRIYGTAYNMSSSDLDITRNRLRRFFDQESQRQMEKVLGGGIHHNLTCAQLFDYYTQSLPA